MSFIAHNSVGQVTSIAHPLDEFYARSSTPLPPIKQIDAEEVPEPYKTLLVHQNDMTSTLESFHKGVIHLRLLGREHRDDEYYREVILLLEGNEKPVEFGAIKINLDRFSSEARQQILEERWPLGHVLRDAAIVYSSQPKAFLQIASDRLINSALNLSGVHLLYGRRNTLLDAKDKPLAEIVEILPPARPKTD